MTSEESLPEARVNQHLRKFIVPGQGVIMARDREYGLFSIARVTESVGGPNYWLVTSVKNRMGFLLPFEMLPPELLESAST